MSKPTARWVRALCVVPAILITATALLVLHPRQQSASTSAAASPATVHSSPRDRIQATYAALPLAFEQNRGQTDAQVKYLARGDGYMLFLTNNDAVFSLHSPAAGRETSAAQRALPDYAKAAVQHIDKTAVVRMHLLGGNSQAQVSAAGQLPGTANYYIGNDPQKWHTGVARYARVSYQDVYPGVSLAYHGAHSQLEFDLVVAPGANPASIDFQFTGNQSMLADDSGNLVISSAAGNVLLHKPVAYQEQNGSRQPVDARFSLQAGNQITFALGNYDRTRELIIDPTVSYTYSTYLGGTLNDEGQAIVFDPKSGDAFVTGQTASSDFPNHSNTFGGSTDVFVTTIKPDGSGTGYSVYIGGSGADSGNGIAVDSSGNAFVAGSTASADFPFTAGAFQTVFGTGAVNNAFVAKLNSTGVLTYSTFLGGSGTGANDVALGIAVDSSGNAYTAGLTSSINFPTSATPLQSFPGGTHNGFVTKLTPSGGGAADLVYSTYLGLGGMVGDSVNAIAVDSSGNAYVTGAASGSGFHTTTGAFQTANAGNSDAFVTVINASGNGYVYSTFLGGSNDDLGDGIAVDSAGDAYVTGQTASSSDFPLKSAAQATYGGGSTDAFVTKLNSTGTALIYSTYLGGSAADLGASIAVDGGGNAYITGQTLSSDFNSMHPTQSSPGGNSDAFVTEFNSVGSLAFSTYLGGSGDEDDNTGNFGAIAVDVVGANIYVTGNTASPNFPVQGAAFQTTKAGGDDAFVVKYSQVTFTLAATTPAAVAPGTPSSSTITLTSVNNYSSGVTLSCTVTGSGSPLPACSITGTNPQTPSSGGATSTARLTTTGPSGANFFQRNIFYAMWLPIAGLSLVGISFNSTRSRRRKLLGILMVGMVMAALLLMPACGGSSSHTTTPPPPNGGTPAGNYTVTITGTGSDANATTQATQVTLTVN